jgi:hypothetical protein
MADRLDRKFAFAEHRVADLQSKETFRQTWLAEHPELARRTSHLKRELQRLDDPARVATPDRLDAMNGAMRWWSAKCLTTTTSPRSASASTDSSKPAASSRPACRFDEHPSLAHPGPGKRWYMTSVTTSPAAPM